VPFEIFNRTCLPQAGADLEEMDGLACGRQVLFFTVFQIKRDIIRVLLLMRIRS